MFRLTVVLSCMLWCGLGFASQVAHMDDFQSWFAHMRTFSAQYVQNTTDETGQLMQSAKGEILLARPGSFVWHSRGDQRYDVISDGSMVWYYDHDLKQVTRQRLSDLPKNSAAILLSSPLSDVVRPFSTRIQGSRDNYRVTWRSRTQDSDIAEIQWVIVGNQLVELILEDAMSQTTHITFSHQRTNKGLAQNQFQFVRPHGVALIDQTG